MSKPPDLVQGTLDVLLLKIIALQPLHGWAISQRLKQVSDKELQVSAVGVNQNGRRHSSGRRSA